MFCTQTYAKCGFWANFVPTCEYKTSRDLATDGPIFANLVSKDAQDLKEKESRKGVSRSAAVARQSRISYGGGGVILVKIGLSRVFSSKTKLNHEAMMSVESQKGAIAIDIVQR